MKDKPSVNKQALWQALRSQAEQRAEREPLLRSYYYASVINHSAFEHALAHILAEKLHSTAVPELLLSEVFNQCLASNESILSYALADMVAYFERDPACESFCRPFLNYKGYQAVQAHRLAHVLWQSGRKYLARYIHFQSSLLFGVDIHPAAKIGYGFMVDHATGIVIGETSEVGNDVSMLHGVTLGGTGKESGKRHPSLGDGVMVSCGAKLLGNIHIGDGVKVGGGSLVLQSVPAHVTVVGVPAKVVGAPRDDFPSLSMDQQLNF